MSNHYLTVKNIDKSFGTTKILKNIELYCEKGELICLLGPSGCGKTTLLRIIAGLETQDTGVLTQDGRDISHLPVQKRDFGIVFQSYALFPNLTVEKNIGYGLRKHANKTQRINDLMAMVGLSEHAKKFPSQISGGQQQRVALARALAIEPNLLLLDEPLSALDAKVREHLRQEIKGLQQRLGVTTLMVTHDQEEAMSMADKIVVMNAGRIEQVGSPHEIYANPVSPFVASFVGSMNFLPAQIQDKTISCLDITLNTATLENADSLSGDVQLGMRPEEIIFSTDTSVANSIPVSIDKIEFLGAFVRLFTSHEASKQDILIDISNEQFIKEDITVGLKASAQFKTECIKLFTNDSDNDFKGGM